MSFSIRRSLNEKLIRKLHKKIFPSDEFYEHKNNYYWVIKDSNNKPVGFCIAADIGENLFFFARAGVVESCRGNGLHKRMIRVRQSYARKLGFKHILTYTLPDNYPSICHLIKERFQIYDPDWDYAGSEVTYFIKDL